MDQLVRGDRTAAANHFVLDALPHALDQEPVAAANDAALCKGDQRFWNRASEAAALVNDRQAQILMISRVNGRDAEQNHVILNSIYLGALPRRNINE